MINLLIVIFGISMLYMATSSRIAAQTNMLRLQGIVLCIITIFAHINELDTSSIWAAITSLFTHVDALVGATFLILETFVVKALIIPNVLDKVAERNNIKRDNNPQFPNFYTLVISTIILFAGFMIASSQADILQNISSLYFGVSVSTIITAFVFIAIKKKLLTHVIGFAMLENGIFLLSLSIAKEMPLIVNLGVLLDVFIAVFILGLLIGEIGHIYGNPDVSQLCNLKDSEMAKDE